MISIVIPFYIIDEETEEMTKTCIAGYRETMTPEDELILIDDSSPEPHTIEGAIRTEKNLGNAGTWNLGAKHAKGDILLFSDNDIDPREWRTEMIKGLNKFDVVFPVVYNERMAAEERHLAGECFMVRRELVDKIGPFDEIYGSYFEDTDFFQRVILAGGKLGVVEGTYMVHRSQGTFRKVMTSEQLEILFQRNKKIYESKFGAVSPYLFTDVD